MDHDKAAAKMKEDFENRTTKELLHNLNMCGIATNEKDRIKAMEKILRTPILVEAYNKFLNVKDFTTPLVLELLDVYSELHFIAYIEEIPTIIRCYEDVIILYNLDADIDKIVKHKYIDRTETDDSLLEIARWSFYPTIIGENSY